MRASAWRICLAAGTAARADRALYAAKAAGRDRVTVGARPVAAAQELQGS